MKLRNKKTGEIDEFLFETIRNTINLYRRVGTSDTRNIWRYSSLAEFNEEWEDYEPKEPKLNGEVGEIVRHWANLHGCTYVKVGFIERNGQTIFHVVSPDARKRIEFLGAYVADDFEAGDYTIYELCGEEE